jgi:hypothetical protein
VNSSAANKVNQATEQGLGGFEDFYDVDSVQPQEEPGNSQGTAQPTEKFVGIAQWLTVEEAAKRLEISQNAIIKRLGKGKLPGRKVAGQYGEKWMVDPSGLPQEIHVQIAEEQPAETKEEPGTSKGTASQGQEQPAGHDSIAQKSFDILADVIRQQTEQIKLQNELIKNLSTQVQNKDSEIKLLTDSHHKPGWWANFCSWFKA